MKLPSFITPAFFRSCSIEAELTKQPRMKPSLLKLSLSLLVSVQLGILPAQAANTTDIEGQLLNDIKQSRQSLQKVERLQLNQRQSLAKKLHAVEQDVEKMREQYATVQRLADEKTLALDELQQRLKKWQDQDAYQRYALLDFFGQQNTETTDSTFTSLLTQLQQYADKQQQALTPAWHNEKVIDTLGQLQQAQVLRLGPVNWALTESGTGGLLDQETERNQQSNIGTIILAATTEQSRQWQQLQQKGYGTLHFDPSLNRAIKLAQQQESIVDHVSKGGLWAMPILLFGLIAILCALAKTWQLWRIPKWLPAISSRVKNSMQRGDFDSAEQLQKQCQGSQAKLLAICLNEANINQREDAMFNYLMLDKQKLEKWLGTIAIIAAVAPLLGLLGTVSGMIETFKLMTLFGSGDASAVSGGISEALVTTELGLIVAIPALLLHAILHRWVKQQFSYSEAFAIELSQLEFKSSGDDSRNNTVQAA